MDIQRINPEQRWSDATVFRGIVHFVEVPASVDGDIADQTRQILARPNTRWRWQVATGLAC